MSKHLSGFLHDRSKTIWAILFASLILYIPLNIILLYLGFVDPPKLQDFGAYYNAAVRFLNGESIYRVTSEITGLDAQLSEDMPYLYPPVFVLLFVPFTVFPPLVAGYAWDLCVLTFLIWSVTKLVSSFSVEFNTMSKILLYVSVISFGPTVTWIKAGQVSGFLTGILCLSAASLRHEKHKWSGVYTTIGSAFKPFYATSGAHLIRHRIRFIYSILSLGLIIIGSFVIFGISESLKYFDVLTDGKGWEVALGPSSWNAGHFNPFYIFGPLKHLPRIALVTGTIGIAFYSRRSDIPIEYIFALGVAIIPFAGPTANTLALNAVIPAFLVVGLYELEQTEGVSDIIPASIFLIHIHPYTVEFFSKFGPDIHESFGYITPIVPVLQPALFGLGLFVGYILYLIYKY